MRILMITDFYWPFVGGVEQHVRRLSQSLAIRGHEVAVVTLRHQALTGFEQDGPVRVYRVRSLMQRSSWLFSQAERPWAPPFPDPEVTRGLRRVLQQEQPEIVHGHDWLARSFLPLKSGSNARLVMSLHYYTRSCAKKSLMFHGAPCSGPGLIKCLTCSSGHYGPLKGIPVTVTNWISSAAERAKVDMFIPVSKATAEGNGLQANDPFQVIPNFMPSKVNTGLDISSYLAQLPQEKFLLFVGDLRSDKGIHVLLSAYAGLQQAPPLVIIGKTWAESPAEFPPNVFVFKNWPNESVLAAWERSLMGIVPSLWPEPFGIVVIEAMASGVPVIASNVGGIPDIIEPGKSGILVPPGDPAALQEAILGLLRDPGLRAELGRSAQGRAAAFSADAVVPRIERVYQDLLRNKSVSHEPTAPGKHRYQQL